MKGDLLFQVLKNVIIEQNRELLKIIADRFHLDEEELLQKYLKPAYYLPVVTQ